MWVTTHLEWFSGWSFNLSLFARTIPECWLGSSFWPVKSSSHHSTWIRLQLWTPLLWITHRCLLHVVKPLDSCLWTHLFRDIQLVHLPLIRVNFQPFILHNSRIRQMRRVTRTFRRRSAILHLRTFSRKQGPHCMPSFQLISIQILAFMCFIT